MLPVNLIPASHVGLNFVWHHLDNKLKLDSKANNYIRRWLGLSRYLSIHQLLVQTGLGEVSVWAERLSRPTVSCPKQQSRSLYRMLVGCHAGSWPGNPSPETPGDGFAAAARQNRFFGWREVTKKWSKTTKKERKEPVISEVIKIEEESYKIRVMGQQQQGWWWSTEPSHGQICGGCLRLKLSFLIRVSMTLFP